MGLTLILLMALFVSIAVNIKFAQALRGHKGEEQ